MKVQPKHDFLLLGTDFRVDKERVYEAVRAVNQPKYQERRAVFLLDGENSMLLEGDDYVLIER